MTTGRQADELHISCVNGSDEIRSLLHWLNLEDEFRGRVALRNDQPAPGEMGSGHDSLVVLLGSGGAGAVLARSLFTWLSQRRSNIKITVESPGGLKVDVDAHQVSDVEALTRQVAELMRSEAPSE